MESAKKKITTTNFFGKMYGEKANKVTDQDGQQEEKKSGKLTGTIADFVISKANATVDAQRDKMSPDQKKNYLFCQFIQHVCSVQALKQRKEHALITHFNKYRKTIKLLDMNLPFVTYIVDTPLESFDEEFKYVQEADINAMCEAYTSRKVFNESEVNGEGREAEMTKMLKQQVFVKSTQNFYADIIDEPLQERKTEMQNLIPFLQEVYGAEEKEKIDLFTRLLAPKSDGEKFADWEAVNVNKRVHIFAYYPGWEFYVLIVQYFDHIPVAAVPYVLKCVLKDVPAEPTGGNKKMKEDVIPYMARYDKLDFESHEFKTILKNPMSFLFKRYFTKEVYQMAFPNTLGTAFTKCCFRRLEHAFSTIGFSSDACLKHISSAEQCPEMQGVQYKDMFTHFMIPIVKETKQTNKWFEKKRNDELQAMGIHSKEGFLAGYAQTILEESFQSFNLNEFEDHVAKLPEQGETAAVVAAAGVKKETITKKRKQDENIAHESGKITKRKN